MNKKLIVTLTIALTLIGGSLFFASNFTPKTKEYKLTYNKKVDEGFGNEIIANMPYYLKNELNDVVVTENDTFEKAGKYSFGLKSIVLQSDYADNEVVVYHEVGHHFGEMTGAHNTDEWKEIYNEEWKHLDIYGATDRYEAFAETVAVYFTGIDNYHSDEEIVDLGSKPLTVAYIEKVIAEFGIEL